MGRVSGGSSDGVEPRDGNGVKLNRKEVVDTVIFHVCPYFAAPVGDAYLKIKIKYSIYILIFDKKGECCLIDKNTLTPPAGVCTTYSGFVQIFFSCGRSGGCLNFL